MYRIIIFLFAFLFACSGSGSDKKHHSSDTDSDTPAVIVTDDTVPDIIDDTETPDIIPEDPDPLELSVKYIIFQDGEQVKFFNGSSVVVKQNGKSTYAGDRVITVNDKLYYMDSAGNISSQYSLNITPDFCAIDLDGNAWTGEVIPPNDTDMHYYFKVYKNNIYQKTIQAQIVNMFLCGSDIIAISNTGVYYDISGNKTEINSASGFVVYDFDATLRTAKIDGITVSWSTNFFNTAKEWNGGYSWNGYKWDGVTLTEDGSALACWRVRANYPISLPENAVVISAGSSVFAGETHYFFIECNSGWLFKYVPSSDTLQQITRLYTGDGYRDTGIYYSKILQPVCSHDSLYFKFDDGGLYRMRFDSLQISFVDFCDGYAEAW